MSSIFNSPYKFIYLSGLIVFLIAAFFSEGYLHPDEHFQILEFANYKLGFSPGEDLPWEFQAQIRPALQPFLAMGVIRTLMFIHIDNPFTWAVILRLLTALFSWFVISRMSFYMTREITDEYTKKMFLFICFFLWFIPAISVRFSSENYGGLTFLLALYSILNGLDDTRKKKIINLVFGGLLLGFSFYFRFQMAFAILGLGIWLIFMKKLKWFDLGLIIFSGIISVFISTIVDYFFYEKWLCTPWNYFKENIIADRASDFGVSPWWNYFKLFFETAFPPMSVVLLIFFFIGLFKKSKHVLTWCIIPFIIGHMMVGHKEMRFMFPMVFAFIFIASGGLRYLMALDNYRKTIRVILTVCIIINIPLLAINSILPARDSVCYFRFLHNKYSDQKFELLSIGKNIYETVGLKVNFYKSKNIHSIVVADTAEVNEFLNTFQPDFIYYLQQDPSQDISNQGYEKEDIYSLIPQWILKNNSNHWQDRTSIWKIEKLRRIK
ncbi:MAG TPA: hypothetical protein VFG10_12555 [Saprospiraceae bacterium]|nr:hypothetical protein [Saprospiraceae bacterium]